VQDGNMNTLRGETLKQRSMAAGFALGIAVVFSAQAGAVTVGYTQDFVSDLSHFSFEETHGFNFEESFQDAAAHFTHGPTAITMGYIVDHKVRPELISLVGYKVRKYPLNYAAAQAGGNADQGIAGGGEAAGGDGGGGGGAGGGASGGGGGPSGSAATSGGVGAPSGPSSPISAVPLPPALPMLLTAFMGLATLGRRKTVAPQTNDNA
jgi:uncharacterized membrane protein YgcG